jgi:hypothetical protein
MKILLLLRGDAFRSGRSGPIENIEQPLQLEVFETVLEHIVSPLEKDGHIVNVAIDVCVSSDAQETQLRTKAKEILCERIEHVHISKERCPKQRLSLNQLFDRQNKRMKSADVVILTRCDLFWFKCPLPKEITADVIWGLYHSPKKISILNDVFHIIPSTRLDEYISFFKDLNDRRISGHSIDLVLDKVCVLTDKQFMCDTSISKNPFYFMVGRERSTKVNTETFPLKKILLTGHSA